MMTDSDPGNKRLERVCILGWDEETLLDAIEEATQLVTAGSTGGSAGALATAFLQQLAADVRQMPHVFLEHLGTYAPLDAEQSHWMTLRDLLDSDLPCEAVCAELQQRYADPTPVLLHFVEVLMEGENEDHVLAPSYLYPFVRQVSRALLFFGAPEGLRYVVRHERLLTMGNNDYYRVAVQRSGAALDALAAELFAQLDPLHRYTLVALFEEHDVPSPKLRDAALQGEAAHLTYQQQEAMIEMLMGEPDPRLAPKLRSFLDAALTQLAVETTEEGRRFTWWAMHRLVVMCGEPLSDAQIAKAAALDLEIPTREAADQRLIPET